MAKETTIYEYIQLADKPYGGTTGHNTSAHKLPAHIKPFPIDGLNDSSKVNTPDKKFYDPNFYGETYHNEETNEVFVIFRGSATLGDMADWPEVAIGKSTGQKNVTEKYIEYVAQYLGEKKGYEGVIITVVGDSYGGLQAQEAQLYLNKLISKAELDEESTYQNISQIRGIGSVTPGPGFFDSDDTLNFITINVENDLVKLAGIDQVGVAELDIDSGQSWALPAHLIENTLSYAKNAPFRNWTHDETSVNTLQTDLAQLENWHDSLTEVRDSGLHTGREKAELDEKISDIEKIIVNTLAERLPTFENNALVIIDEGGERINIALT